MSPHRQKSMRGMWRRRRNGRSMNAHRETPIRGMWQRRRNLQVSKVILTKSMLYDACFHIIIGALSPREESHLVSRTKIHFSSRSLRAMISPYFCNWLLFQWTHRSCYAQIFRGSDRQKSWQDEHAGLRFHERTPSFKDGRVFSSPRMGFQRDHIAGLDLVPSNEIFFFVTQG